MSWQQDLDAAIEITVAAGPIALRYFRRPLIVADKSSGDGFDPVTEADREIERFIRAEITRRFPRDGIFGEEEGLKEASGSRQWLVDPIDGTRAFLSGMPLWGILVGLVEGESCRVGAMHQPFMGETYSGDGSTAWLRRHRSGSAEEPIELRSSRVSSLSEAVLYSTHPSMFPGGSLRQRFDTVAARCRMLRYGGDCYSYCLLALGTIDLVIEAELRPFDIVPLIPIIEGAGGVVTDWQGGAPLAGGAVVAAANSTLHREVLDMLQASRSPQAVEDDE